MPFEIIRCTDSVFCKAYSEVSLHKFAATFHVRVLSIYSERWLSFIEIPVVQIAMYKLWRFKNNSFVIYWNIV